MHGCLIGFDIISHNTLPSCMHDIILEKLNIGPIARFYKWMLFSGLAHNSYCPSLNNLIFPFWFELRNSIHNDLNHEFYTPIGVLFIDSFKYSCMQVRIWILLFPHWYAVPFDFLTLQSPISITKANGKNISNAWSLLSAIFERILLLFSNSFFLLIQV